MAMTVEWKHVSDRFQELQRFERLRPTVTAMLRLIADLRKDSRLDAFVPSVSLASLNLKLSGSKRYVVVAWNDSQPQGFEISFVDPSLEFSETSMVFEANVVATIVEYLNKLKVKSE